MDSKRVSTTAARFRELGLGVRTEIETRLFSSRGELDRVAVCGAAVVEEVGCVGTTVVCIVHQSNTVYISVTGYLSILMFLTPLPAVTP